MAQTAKNGEDGIKIGFGDKTSKFTWYIYKITNLLNNRSYVGQRKFSDSSLLDEYFGSGTYLRRSVKKHGRQNFKKEILKDNINCQTAANIFETVYIKKEDTLFPNGYNLTKDGRCFGAHTGHKHSEKTKRKISLTHKGKRKSRESIEKQIQTKTKNNSWFKFHSEKSKKKISESRKGIKFSEVHKRNLSIAHKNPSLEIRTNLAIKAKENQNMKGKHHSEETKEKIRKKLTNKKQSEETKLKRSLSLQGIIRGPMTEDHKRKIMLSKEKSKYLKKSNVAVVN